MSLARHAFVTCKDETPPNEMNRVNRITDYTAKNRIMTSSDTEAEKLKIPLDLSEWCPKETLLAWVKEELEALNWANPELIAHLHAHPAYQPRMWLSLLTFGYATSVCESEEIVRLCYVDHLFQALCAEAVPSPRALSRFRRDNRGLLKWLLSQILKRALREKFALGDALLPAGVRRFLLETANVRLDIARHVDRAAQGA